MIVKNLCSDGATPIWNKSQMESSLVEERLPAWVRTSYSTFVEKLRNPAYPCFWATIAEEKGTFRYAIASSLTEPSVVKHTLQAIRMFFAEVNAREQSQDEEVVFLVLTLFFPPEPKILTVQQYHQQAWGFLNALQALDDTMESANVSTDLLSPDWRYVLGGRTLFTIISTPAHCKRRAHNLGSGMSIAFQVMDVLNQPFVCSIVEKIQATSMKITERVKQYDTTPPIRQSDDAYNSPSWYFIPDDNKDKPLIDLKYKSIEDSVTGCPSHEKRSQD